jgi:hypothetical protein
MKDKCYFCGCPTLNSDFCCERHKKWYMERGFIYKDG